jgi:hypothetical protein
VAKWGVSMLQAQKVLTASLDKVSAYITELRESNYLKDECIYATQYETVPREFRRFSADETLTWASAARDIGQVVVDFESRNRKDGKTKRFSLHLNG